MARVDIWWSSLTIVQKERIAAKAAEKEGNKDADVTYPACTRWWNSITEERRQWIYDHCTDKHGLLLAKWKEGKSMSY